MCSKFYLEGYTPSLFIEAKLLIKSEALVCNEPKTQNPALSKARASPAKFKFCKELNLRAKRPKSVKAFVSFVWILKATRPKEVKAKNKAKQNKKPESDFESNSETSSSDSIIMVLEPVLQVQAVKASTGLKNPLDNTYGGKICASILP